MDPNQQPNQPSASGPPLQPAPYPQPGTAPGSPTPQSPPQQSQPVFPQTPPPQPTYPQPPSTYQAPAASQPFDANYLDSIAPPPPRPSFLSGSFGKIFFGLIGVFVLVVSLIIAFSGQDQTADLQQVVVRLDNMAKTAKTVDKHIKSTNLSNINSNYQIWITGNKAEGEDLLKKGGVKKTDYSKSMVAKETELAKSLDAKFEDARLSARLSRVYSTTMATETEKMINLLNTMSRKSKSAQIRDYAKNASTNLSQIQKDFDEFVDDGN